MTTHSKSDAEHKHHKPADDVEEQVKETEEEIAKKNERSLITILVVIAVIIIIFVGIYYVTNMLQKEEAQKPITNKRAVYNNYVFNKQADGTWLLSLNIRNAPYVIPFYYLPYDVENIPVNQTELVRTMNEFKKISNQGIVYIAMNPDDPSKIVVASVEIARILGTRYNIFNFDVRTAITSDSASGPKNYPIITCQNASENTLVFFIHLSNSNNIDVNNNCITINAKSLNETIMVSDALAYRMLSIIR